MTEVWYRNPDNYIRELVEVGEYHIAWDRGLLVKRKLDPIKHAELHIGKAYPWRILAIGEQGTAEYRDGDSQFKPTAVYPTWSYGEDQGLLEEMVEDPVGQDIAITSNTSVPGDERPVLGQEHRVVITDIPDVRSGMGRKFLLFLKTLQEDNPECIIHIHGLYSWRAMFGMGFAAADVDPRTDAHKGKVILPNGKIEKFEQTNRHPSWVTMLGYKPIDLSVARVRCMYNIKSSSWAGKHFREDMNFPVKNTGAEVDTTSSDLTHKPIEAGKIVLGKSKAGPGDKFHCDTCSLADHCKYFRTGAVCSVPGAEPKALSTFFKTRDSDTIIEGLGTLVAANARRLERGMHEETQLGEHDREVTKMMGQVFDQGVKLAKLIDPNLRGGTKVQVNVGSGGNAAVVAGANPRQLIATVMRELEQQGISRDQITQEMVQGVLAGMQNPEQARRAIEGHRVINEDGTEVA